MRANVTWRRRRRGVMALCRSGAVIEVRGAGYGAGERVRVSRPLIAGREGDGMLRPVHVAVLGGGSWGTTVASLAAANATSMLWSRDPQTAAEVNEHHRNQRYLGDLDLHPELRGTTSLEEAVYDADIIVVGVPSHAVRQTLVAVAPLLRHWVPIVSLTKGLEQGTRLRMTEVIEQELPGHPAGRAGRTEPGARGAGRIRRRSGHRDARRARRHVAAAGVLEPPVPGVHQPRCHRLRAGRRAQERRRHRRRHGRGVGPGRQHQGDGADPRPGRDHPARRGDGRRPAHLPRADRVGRPDGDVHQPAQPQPHRGRRAGQGSHHRRDHHRHAHGRRGRQDQSGSWSSWPASTSVESPIACEVDAVVHDGRTPLDSFAGLGRVPPSSEFDGTA